MAGEGDGEMYWAVNCQRPVDSLDGQRGKGCVRFGGSAFKVSDRKTGQAEPGARSQEPAARLIPQI